MKVGVLYPRSKVYPDITTDFVNGLKSYLKEEQLTDSVHLTLESIGYGGAEKEVYEKVEKLMLLDEVDLVVGYIDEKVISILQPLLQACGKLLLVVNSGANYPDSWGPQPGVIRLNLQDAFLCGLAGELAAQQEMKTALVATTFYDCGYLHLATMVNGFSNRGGMIVFNYVNKQQPSEVLQIDELTTYLDSSEAASNLLCVVGSEAASSLYGLLNKHKNAAGLHLFVSPMMLEAPALEKINEGFQFSIDGHLPWMLSSENARNREFAATYQAQTKKQPTLFALLGWETGMVLSEIFAQCKSDYANGAAIPGMLSQRGIQGPRGEMKFDPATHHFLAPFYKFSLASNSTRASVEQIPFPQAAWENYIAQPTGGIHSGWTNTYLCY